MMSTNMDADFFRRIPKVELHAHINGSISDKTMEKLLSQKNQQGSKLTFDKGQTATLEDCFRMFKLIHQVSDNSDAAYMITYDVIHEFADDNVKYLELRTTPRDVASTGMTKQSYIEAVLKAIGDCHNEKLDIIVRLLLAVDRRNGVDVAMETVELADKYKQSTGGIVLGIDLSGDPNVGNAIDFIPAFEEAKRRGLKLALHLAEVPALEETLEVVQISPDRIGHGTCLHTEAGGSEELVNLVSEKKIPLELCLTSNVIGQTVPNFDNHQFKFWYDRRHPCIICTDDKGVFNTTLSEEYAIAAKTFDLTKGDIWTLSYNSIDHIFAGEDVKERLRTTWDSCKSQVLSS